MKTAESGQNRTSLHRYRPSRFLRWLPVAALLIILVFAQVVLVAAVFEGMAWGGSWTVVILLALAGYFAVNYWQMAYTVILHHDHLTLRRFGREIILPYTQITSSKMGRTALTLHTGDGKIHLYGESNPLAELRAFLETHVPTLARQRDARRSSPLPIHLRKEPLFYLAPFALIFVSLILLGGLSWAWFSGGLAPNLRDVLLTLAFVCASGLTLSIGIGMLNSFVHRITFDEDMISLHNFWRDRTYPVESLRDIRLQATERTVRGIRRSFYRLAFVFEDQERPVEIGPSFVDSLGIRQEHARQQLTALRQALLRRYLPVTQVPGEQVSLPRNEWGRGYVKRRFVFKAFDLQIQEEDFGEHHNGAWAIHFTFNRPLVEGITCFRTTNGVLQYSDDGRYLVLHDFTQIVLFDLAQINAYHYRLERGWQFQRVWLKRGELRWECLSLTRPPHTVVLNPVPLTREDLGRALAPGTGTHPPGDFPSAWPSRAPAAPPTRKPLSPSQAVADVLGYARSLGDRLPEAFEDLRDSLNALGPEAMPHILEAARATEDGNLLEVLVAALVDKGYPPAYPDFVTWLDHPHEVVRFFCASALDDLANGAFGISQMIPGGFVEHDRIRETTPQITEWWYREGKQSVRTLFHWRQEMDASQPISELEKWFNFVELNPTWIKFGDGTVAPQEPGFCLPRRKGTHVVAGQVWLLQASEPVFGAFVMESDLGWVGGVYIKEGRRWLEVSQRMIRAEPNFGF